MDLETIKNSIQTWDQVRKTDLGLPFLTSGSGFEINRDEYEKWADIILNEEASIHLYIGILGFEIVFYLVDSISDAQENYVPNETIFMKNFIKKNIRSDSTSFVIPNDFEINDTEAAKRAFKWFFYSDLWADKKLHPSKNDPDTGMVRVFTIHFEDFKALFQDNDNHTIFVFFGLKDFYNEHGVLLYKNEIEVILCSEKGFLDLEGKSEDVTIPYPPFSRPNGFNLINM